MRCVGRTLGEEGLEGLFDKAGAVFARRPNLIHPEDTSVVEAGAVVDRPRGISEVEKASAERVVIHGVAVVVEVELGDMRMLRVGRMIRQHGSMAGSVAAVYDLMDSAHRHARTWATTSLTGQTVSTGAG